MFYQGKVSRDEGGNREGNEFPKLLLHAGLSPYSNAWKTESEGKEAKEENTAQDRRPWFSNGAGTAQVSSAQISVHPENDGSWSSAFEKVADSPNTLHRTPSPQFRLTDEAHLKLAPLENALRFPALGPFLKRWGFTQGTPSPREGLLPPSPSTQRARGVMPSPRLRTCSRHLCDAPGCWLFPLPCLSLPTPHSSFLGSDPK